MAQRDIRQLRQPLADEIPLAAGLGLGLGDLFDGVRVRIMVGARKD